MANGRRILPAQRPLRKVSAPGEPFARKLTVVIEQLNTAKLANSSLYLGNFARPGAQFLLLIGQQL